MHQARVAAEEAAAARAAHLAQQKAARAEAIAEERLHYQELRDLKREKRKNHVSKSALATLEMVYAKSRYPSDKVVNSISDLHSLSRKQVLDWFAQRRRGGPAAEATADDEEVVADPIIDQRDAW